jgi:hypothetical protein
MATWWTKPDGKRVLVLDVMSTAPDETEFQCLVLDMTRELALALLARFALVNEWRKVDPALDVVEFNDNGREYRARALSGNAIDEEENYAPTWDVDDTSRLDNESLVIFVRSAYLEWRAEVGDEPDRLNTVGLTEADLRMFVDGGDPWPSTRLVCPECGDELTDTTKNGRPSYCGTCDREVA